MIRYIFGMFDAVTMNWGIQIRKELGEGTLRLGFVGDVTSECSPERESVIRILDEIFAQLNNAGRIETACNTGIRAWCLSKTSRS